MIEALLSLPIILGSLVFMGLTCVIGVTTYIVSHNLIAKYEPDGINRDAASSLFRVVGLLLSLFLSLTFADVVLEMNSIESATEQEAVAILDTYHDLRRFGAEETRDIQSLLMDYTRAVIDDDWPALANDRLGHQAGTLLWQFENAVLKLKATDKPREAVWSRMITDIDKISDLRLSRLQHALKRPPFFLVAVMLGFLVTMVCFGAYPPNRALLALVSLYTVFIGLVIYFILAFSDPFEGVPGVDTSPLEDVLQKMQAQDG